MTAPCDHGYHTWDAVSTIYRCRGCDSQFTWDEATLETVPLPASNAVVKAALEVISGAIDDAVAGRPTEDVIGEIGNAVDSALAALRGVS